MCLCETGIRPAFMQFPPFPWSCFLSCSFQPEYRTSHFLYLSIISLSPGFSGEAKLNILKDQLRYCKWKVSTSNYLLCGFLANQWAYIYFGFHFEAEPSFCFKFRKGTVQLSICIRLSSVFFLPGMHSWWLVRVMLSGSSNALSPVLVGTQYLW